MLLYVYTWVIPDYSVELTREAQKTTKVEWDAVIDEFFIRRYVGQ